MTYRVAILGAGNIAQGYDTPESGLVLTHAKGFLRHPGFFVVGICDKDAAKARAAAEKWGIPNHGADLGSQLELKPDAFSICTPDSFHPEHLWACLKAKPKAVFCEKPLSLDPKEAEEIVSAFEREGVALLVNYSRRWVPELLVVKQAIASGKYGKIVTARAKYYKGLFHNGSHLLDLLCFFLSPSPERGARLLEISDYSKEDPTISASAICSSNGSKFQLTLEGYDSRKLMPIELELVFERGKILLEELDRTWLTTSTLAENPTYPGYYEFSRKESLEVSSSAAMKNAIENLYQVLNKSAEPASTGRSALETLKLCAAFKALPEVNNV